MPPTQTADYSEVTVRVPFTYPPDHVSELNGMRDRFPGIQLQAGSANRVVVSCDAISPLATEVYEWTRENLPAA